MNKHKKEKQEWIDEQELLFHNVISIVSKIKLKHQKNVYIDSILYGVAINLTNCSNKTQEELQKYYSKLLEKPSFSKENIQEGTAKKEAVKDRLNDAKLVFGGDFEKPIS